MRHTRPLQRAWLVDPRLDPKACHREVPKRLCHPSHDGMTKLIGTLYLPGNIGALGIADRFGRHHDGISDPGKRRFDCTEEAGLVECNLRDQQDMRPVMFVTTEQRRRCCEPTRIPAHRLHDHHTVIGAHCSQVSRDLLRDRGPVPCRTAVPGAPVRSRQVVVYRLGNSVHAKRMAT